MSASSVRSLARSWVGNLATYRHHRNDEHLEALVGDALRFAGIALEEPLAASSYWSTAPLARRVAVLLFLVDRGVVHRVGRKGRVAFEAADSAEGWVAAQSSLAPYLEPTLELIAALRADQARHSSPSS